MTQPAPEFTPPSERRLGTGLISQTLKHSKQVRWWHEAIIDDMLASPLSSNRERAQRLGYSESYLSTIINSDMFRGAYLARRQQYSELLDASLSHKVAKVADAGLDLLLKTMEKKQESLPFAVVAETTLGVLEKLGFGVKPQAGGVTVNVNQNTATLSPVSAEMLQSARDRLRMAEAVQLQGPESQAQITLVEPEKP